MISAVLAFLGLSSLGAGTIGLGVVGVAVLAFVAPLSKILSGVGSFLEPVLSALGSALGGYLSMLKDGGGIVLDKGRAIVFCATLCVGTYAYGHHVGWTDAYSDAHAHYRLIPKRGHR